VEFRDGLADLAEGCCGCFDHQETFLRFFHLALPAVYGFDLRHDVNARGKAALDQLTRDFARFLLRACSRENDSFVGHIESAVSISRRWSAIGRDPTTDAEGSMRAELSSSRTTSLRRVTKLVPITRREKTST